MWPSCLCVFFFYQDFLLKEEYRALEYNLTTTEVELVNVSASWDEVCSHLSKSTTFTCLNRCFSFFTDATELSNISYKREKNTHFSLIHLYIFDKYPFILYLNVD